MYHGQIEEIVDVHFTVGIGTKEFGKVFEERSHGVVLQREKERERGKELRECRARCNESELCVAFKMIKREDLNILLRDYNERTKEVQEIRQITSSHDSSCLSVNLNGVGPGLCFE